MKTLALKVLGFFLFALSLFMWGSVSAKLKMANKRAKDAIKKSKDYETDNNIPYVDNPASFLCHSDNDLPDLPKNDKEAGKEA